MEFRTRFASWDLSALLVTTSSRETASRAHRRRHRDGARSVVPQQKLSAQTANPTNDKPLPPRSE
jgi:hypothetical protein